MLSGHQPQLGFLEDRFFFSSRRRHTRFKCDWSSDVCSSDLIAGLYHPEIMKVIVKRRPNWLIALSMLGIRHGMLNKWFAPHVKAIAQRHLYTREQMNRIDRVMVPTRLMGKILKKHGLRKKKIRYAPYGMNLENLQPTGKLDAGNTLRLCYIVTFS